MKNFTKSRFLVVSYLTMAILAGLATTACDYSDQKTDQMGIEEKWSDYTYFEMRNGQKVPKGSGGGFNNPPALDTGSQVLPKPESNTNLSDPSATVAVAEAGKTKRTFTWYYRAQAYTLEVSLDNNLDYQKPALLDNEEAYYSKFLITKPNDNSVKEVAQKLRALATARNLNDDQFLELMAVFAQSIPYDNYASAPRFPYETLLDGTGDCDDKSLLCYKIMEAEGYDVALISYPDHMVVGVGCPTAVSLGNSGFAYLNVTGPYRDPIGYMPEERRGQAFDIFLPRTGGKIFHGRVYNNLNA